MVWRQVIVNYENGYGLFAMQRLDGRRIPVEERSQGVVELLAVREGE